MPPHPSVTLLTPLTPLTPLSPLASDVPVPVRHPRRSEEHTSELQSPYDLVCRLLLEKKTRPFVPETNVVTTNRYLVAYFAYTLPIDKQWILTLAGRFKYVRVAIAARSSQDAGLNGSS